MGWMVGWWVVNEFGNFLWVGLVVFLGWWFLVYLFIKERGGGCKVLGCVWGGWVG